MSPGGGGPGVQRCRGLFVRSHHTHSSFTACSVRFREYYPSVRVEISSAGSSTAPPALREGSANFGPMSRPMRDSEIDAFEEEYAYRPVVLPVAVDMLAVYVHRDNPLKGLTLQQIDAIFPPRAAVVITDLGRSPGIGER